MELILRYFQNLQIRFFPRATSYEEIPDATYTTVMVNLIRAEKLYIRELHMLMLVFRQELLKMCQTSRDVDVIFGNIRQIHDISVKFLQSLEGTLDSLSKGMGNCYRVGFCFKVIKDSLQLGVFNRYARNALSSTPRNVLNDIFAILSTRGNTINFDRDVKFAAKYYLPVLLHSPIAHCIAYIEFLNFFISLTDSERDKNYLKDTKMVLEDKLEPFKNSVLSLKSATILPYCIKSGRDILLEKISKINKTVKYFPKDEVKRCCLEFLKEGTLTVSKNATLKERLVYLFDQMLIFCKKMRQRAVSRTVKWKARKILYLMDFLIVDVADTPNRSNAFLIITGVMDVTLIANSKEDKHLWLASFVMLKTRRALNSHLRDIIQERSHIIIEMPRQGYKFFEPDHPINIILEGPTYEKIKAATLIKLVEKLTKGNFKDESFERIFLLTYRRFCRSSDLLNLLVERFNIPKKPIFARQPRDSDSYYKTTDIYLRNEEWKKHVREICVPVQIRVLEFMRKWIDYYKSNYLLNAILVSKIIAFLTGIPGAEFVEMKQQLYVLLQKKESPIYAVPSCSKFSRLTLSLSETTEYKILSLDVIEISHQLTLMDYKNYVEIKFSEISSATDCDNSKRITGPNITRINTHNTQVMRWLQRSIIKTKDFTERIRVLSRILEIVIILEKVNNFNAFQTFIAALESIPISRLTHTFEGISTTLKQKLEEWKSPNYVNGRMSKVKFQNCPAVPYLANYLNAIIILDSRPTILPNSNLINFAKQRRIVEIADEFLYHQQFNYNFKIDPTILNFLDNLSKEDDSLELFKGSMEIEPTGYPKPVVSETSFRKHKKRTTKVEALKD